MDWIRHCLALCALLVLCWAQVEMREPAPRRSKFSRFYIASDDIDYNMKSPLDNKIGYPCRKFIAGPTQGTLVAGQDLKVFFDGTATRQGGDCQFAISYDNGTSFAVLWDKLTNCFLDTVNGGYEVPIPEKLPAAKEAVFAWTWIPATGSRGYYMNCADVRVENYGQQEKYIGKELLAVNVPGKQDLPPKKFGVEDSLNSMLEQRPLITIGEPLQVTATPTAESSEEASTGSSSTESADGGASDSGTVILYVSEDTSTTTNVVYVTRFITDKDTETDDMYTYGYGIQTRGSMATQHGPLGLPMVGTNVGLTVADDSTATTKELDSFPTFTDDWATSKPTGSTKWMGSDSIDYIPPSAMLPRTQPSRSGSSVDLWPVGKQSAGGGSALGSLEPDSTYPAGTPLFGYNPDTGGPRTLGDEKLGQTDPVLSDLDALSHALSPVITNRPPLKSVIEQVLSRSSQMHSSMDVTQHAAVTLFSTVTMDGKPVLQVVVSSNNTAVPGSLTISYSV